MAPSGLAAQTFRHPHADAGWKVVVKNTFFDLVPEDTLTLKHCSSAPGKLDATACLVQETPVKPSSSLTFQTECNCVSEAIAWDYANLQKALSDVSPKASSEAGSSQSTEVDSAGTDSEENDSLVEDVESMKEPVAVESKATSRTAKRNQRTRQKLIKAKQAAREANAQNPFGSPKASGRGDAELATVQPAALSRLLAEAEAMQRRPLCSQPAAAAKVVKRHGSTELHRSREVTTESPPSPFRNHWKRLDQVKAQSSASGHWIGLNPTAAERLKLKRQFMDLFHQEYQLGEEFRKKNTSKLMTLEELAKFNCESRRPLVSVHGDIFDVSRNLDQYGPDGCRRFEAGSDITWAIISASHIESNCNCFFDVFKAVDDRMLTSRCMSLCSSIAAFQRDYGMPVGRLSIYNDEERLPPPQRPELDGVCPVQ